MTFGALPRTVLAGGTAALGVAGALAVSAPAAAVVAGAATTPAGVRATLVIRTVPAVAGARVWLDGGIFRTGPGGTVKIVTVSGRHRIGIAPPATEPAGTKLHFARWLDGLALADRGMQLSPGINNQQAGFVVSHPVAVRFIDPAGRQVPLSGITQLTMASSLGQRYTFAPASPPSSLPANRIVRDQSGLVPLAIRYSARAVMIAGSNVVYGGSQNFFVHPSGTWTVRVLLFPLRVEVRDALFGFGTGSAVRLTLPDGSSRIVRLGPGHAVTMAGLPRATYQLAAKGPGMGLSAPSALSKPQVAKLLLLSWLDVLAVAAFVVLFLIGLPVLGGRIVRRPHGKRLPTWRVGRAQRPPGAAAAPVGSTAATGAAGDHALPADAAPAAATWADSTAATADAERGTEGMLAVRDTEPGAESTDVTAETEPGGERTEVTKDEVPGAGGTEVTKDEGPGAGGTEVTKDEGPGAENTDGSQEAGNHIGGPGSQADGDADRQPAAVRALGTTP